MSPVTPPRSLAFHATQFVRPNVARATRLAHAAAYLSHGPPPSPCHTSRIARISDTLNDETTCRTLDGMHGRFWEHIFAVVWSSTLYEAGQVGPLVVGRTQSIRLTIHTRTSWTLQVGTSAHESPHNEYWRRSAKSGEDAALDPHSCSCTRKLSLKKMQLHQGLQKRQGATCGQAARSRA